MDDREQVDRELALRAPVEQRAAHRRGLEEELIISVYEAEVGAGDHDYDGDDGGGGDRGKVNCADSRHQAIQRGELATAARCLGAAAVIASPPAATRL